MNFCGNGEKARPIFHPVLQRRRRRRQFKSAPPPPLCLLLNRDGSRIRCQGSSPVDCHVHRERRQVKIIQFSWFSNLKMFDNSLYALFTGFWRGPPTWEILFCTATNCNQNLFYGTIILSHKLGFLGCDTRMSLFANIFYQKYGMRKKKTLIWRCWRIWKNKSNAILH